jgi:tRNA A-37 threonylcarbamoyl transferase component Bud32
MSPSSHSPTPAEPSRRLLDGLSAQKLMSEMMQPTHPDEAAAALPTLTPEELAPHFPQLEILACLGRGGMGVVYKARQRSLNRLIALKLLAPERADDPQFAERFEREAQALAKLNHPNIVAVHDFGRAGGFYYLLMEFVDGMTLRQLLQTERLTPKQALSFVPPVCEALQCAHDHGIVHCDIKPENLLIDHNRVVKIADFGIAKMVEASGEASATLVGTPDYAAPEQIHGAADHRTDIYSLGVVLYEMLTGERPKDQPEAPSQHVQIDLRVDEVVLRALQKQPDRRFATATDLRLSIEALVLPPSNPGAARHNPRPRARFGWKMALAAVLLLGVIGGFALPHFLRQPKTGIPGADWMGFDLGHLSDAFAENILFGKSHYGLTPLGLADRHGLVTAKNMTSEGTLVYRKQSYDLAQLAYLELSCCFQRSELGAEAHAVSLGLTGSLDGHLSGVPGSAFMALRLRVEGDSLRLQYQSKQANAGPPRSWESSNVFTTQVGKWYRLRVTFARVDEQKVWVSGDVCEMDRHGNDGPKLGFFLPRHFAEPVFPVRELLNDRDVWVALRAHGPGGAALLDDLQILARPLPAAKPPVH